VVLSNFGQNDSGLPSGELATLNSFAARFGDGVATADGGSSLVSVPEPASIGIAVAGLVLLARQRRAGG
jgi:PEP-CTERM motif